MTNSLELPRLSLRPDVIQGPAQQPDAISTFLQMFFDAQQNKRQNSTSDAAIEAQKTQTAIAQGHLKLAQEIEKTKQAQLDAASTDAASRGNAAKEFLKSLGPAIEQHAQSHPEVVAGMMGGQGQQAPTAVLGPQPPVQTPIGAPSPVSAPAQATPTQPTWYDRLAQMPDQTAAAFVEEDLPKLMAAKKAMEGPPATQSDVGGINTMFDPTKGYFHPERGLAMSDPKAWSPTIARTMTEDQKNEYALRRADVEARIGANNAYRDSIQAVGIGRQFDTRVRKIRDRAGILNQTQLTLDTALKDPDPANRRVLATSVVVNFIQGADQSAQVRAQIVKYFNDNLDPSLKGQWSIIASKKFHGVLPDNVLKGMIHHIQTLSELTKSEYNMQRNGELKRHPDMKALPAYLPTADEFWTESSNPAAPSPNGQMEPPPPPQ